MSAAISIDNVPVVARADSALRQSMSIISRIKYSDLIDILKLQVLMDSFSEALGIANAVLDVDGTVIVHAGWQDVCVGFHRVNAETCRRCVESDTSLAESMVRGAPYAIYPCHNGLVDAAAPIIVADKHVANIFTGQLLTEPPDIEVFRRQARQFGFDEERYLDSISRVPIVPKERLESITRLYAQLAAMLADNGLDRIKELVAREQLEKEVRERKIAESSALDFATRLQVMTRRHAGAHESERRRLARDIHDRVSSNLTAIGLGLGLIESQLPGDAAASIRDRLAITREVLKDTMLTAREISHDLHPAVLEYGGVYPALEDYARKYSGQTGIEVEMTGKDRGIRLSPDAEIALYRIAQEALTNCAKHADARTVTIEFNGDAEHALFVISDDGIGFDSTWLSNGWDRPGLGLLSMRERAEAIGGKLTLDSAPGLGTRVMVEI